MKQRWKHWCNRLIIEAASLESFPLSAFFSLSSEDQAVASVNVILLSKLIGQPHSADGACALVHNAHALLCNMRMRKCSLCSAAPGTTSCSALAKFAVGRPNRKKTSSCHDQVQLAILQENLGIEQVVLLIAKRKQSIAASCFFLFFFLWQ